MATNQEAEAKLLQRLANIQPLFLDDLLFAMCQGDLETLLLLLETHEQQDQNQEVGLLLGALDEMIRRMRLDNENQRNLLTRRPVMKSPRR